MSDKKWFPLESNPDVMNRYAESLGLSLDAAPLRFVDVFGFDEELLAFVQNPASLLLVFPITDATEKENGEACAAAAENVAKLTSAGAIPFFIKQTISNACGTIGILHALLNQPSLVPFVKEGSFLAKFAASAKNANPEERAALLERSDELEAAQAVAAAEGQTANQDIDAEINLHFIAFVHKAGTLYELDGRKPFPLPRGECTEETFLSAAAKVVQNYIAISSSPNFSIVALAAPAAE
jgi:ubiquitin carboxyl-terminal hydrolase L3